MSNKNNNFPSEFIEDEEKFKDSYALAWASYIEKQELSSNDCIQTKENWRENETFMRGNQDISRLKDILQDGDSSYNKFDWTPLPIIPKVVNVVKANLGLEMYRPVAKAIDPTSTAQRKQKKLELQKNRHGGQLRKDFSRVTGMDLQPNGFTPSSSEEEELYMNGEYKQTQELAIEQAIEVVTKANRHNIIRDQLVDDLMNTGHCIIKTDYDPQYGVSERYIPRANAVFSFDSSQLKDKRDIMYAGEVRSVSYVDLASRYGVDKAEMISHYNGSADSARTRKNITQWEDIANFTVEVLFFEFKTTLSPKYRKKYSRKGKGNFSIVKKESTYKNNHENIQVIEGQEIAWFEGMYVLNSNIVCNYKKREWVAIDSLKKPMSSYIIYDTQQMPLVRRMIPFAERAQRALIKLDQAVASAKPKGIAINQSAIANIVAREGGEPISYLEVVEMYNATGNQIFRQDEYQGNGLPLTELENGMSKDVNKFIEIYNHNMAEIWNMVGINSQMAGMGAESRVSIEAQNMALNSSLKAINFLRQAIVGEDMGIEPRLYEDIIIRVQAIDKYGEKPFKKYVQAIGEYNMDALNEIGKLSPFTFSLDIQSSPTVEQQQELKEDISIALNNGQLTVADKVELNNFKSTRFATLLLKTRIERNMKRAQEEKLQAIRVQEEEVAKASQIKQQGEQQTLTLKMQSEAQKITLEHQAKMEEIQMQGYIDSQIAEGKALKQGEMMQYQAALKEASQGKMEQQKNARQKDQQNFQREQATKKS